MGVAAAVPDTPLGMSMVEAEHYMKMLFVNVVRRSQVRICLVPCLVFEYGLIIGG